MFPEVVGASWDLERVIKDYDVDLVIVTFSTAPHAVLLSMVRRCRALGVEVLVDGDVYRTRSTAPPRRASVTPPPESGTAAARHSSAPRTGARRASVVPPAVKRNG